MDQISAAHVTHSSGYVLAHLLKKVLWPSVATPEQIARLRPPAPIEPARLMGRWYATNEFVQLYEENTTDSMTNYSLNIGPHDHPATIRIENSCLRGGTVLRAQGQAVAVDGDATHSQFVVNFKNMGFSTRFSAVNLCIMLAKAPAAAAAASNNNTSNNTDKNNEGYEYALLGSPTLDGLWFLSRSPMALPPAILQEFRAVAAGAGFDLSQLVAVDQSHNLVHAP